MVGMLAYVVWVTAPYVTVLNMCLSAGVRRYRVCEGQGLELHGVRVDSRAFQGKPPPGARAAQRQL